MNAVHCLTQRDIYGDDSLGYNPVSREPPQEPQDKLFITAAPDLTA